MMHKRRKQAQNRRSSHVIDIVDDALNRAMVCRASDVHFEPTAEALVIKFRLDGVLTPMETLPKVIAENCIARLKVLAGLLTYRNDIPQEGRLEIPDEPQSGITDLRLAVFPTIYGQRAVVRLFYQNEQLTDLDRLGFTPSVLDLLQGFAHASQGIILLTGPAGSGKSTTLAALMRYIIKSTPGRSVVTLEDPVEIRIRGATQIRITPHGELTFPVALRSLLRQDPQVLMIGEIRDAQTAQIVIEAGLTGHLLASTLHSGTPAGALLRLLEMGIEPYQVTSGVCAIINQRLIRRLCDHCKEKSGSDGFVPVGCDRCFHTGFSGRVLIAEAVQLDSPLRKLLLEGADLEALEALLCVRGHENLWTHGQRLVAEGLTSRAELNAVLGNKDSKKGE